MPEYHRIMCGLTGIISPTSLPAEARAHVMAMADTLRHRGPDGEGSWLDHEAGIALGHRRLAVIELSDAGRQPMHSARGRYVIALNGEIYNHRELRSELERQGRAPKWRGLSDTETLLAAIAAWGLQPSLKHCVGMFALALWDRVERQLHLARDRFGEKPLYYGWSRGVFLFGSELKPLTAYPGFDNEIDRDALGLFLRFSYVPAPRAIYRSIFKLEPGCVLTMSPAAASAPPGAAPTAPASHPGLTIERYWSLAQIAARGLSDPFGDEQEAIEAVESALAQAVGQQSIADVPLGAFLSGGIDSSTIVALMQTQASRPVRTFSVGFAETGFDEAGHARQVAEHLGTEHNELYVSPRETLEVVSRLPRMYCEPFADSSQIPTYLISRMARQQVTVGLSGDGGDELFGGYARYHWARRLWQRMDWLPLRARRSLAAIIAAVPVAAWDRLGQLAPGRGKVTLMGDKAHKLARALGRVESLEELYWHLATEWHDAGIVRNAGDLRLACDDAAPALAAGPEQWMMLCDGLTYLPDDILHKLDRSAMAVGLETRAPFLDHRVAEAAWRLPLDMKLRDGQGKWALRQILNRHVPRHLIERPKAGFAIPMGQWLRGPLRDWADDLLSPERIRAEGFFASGPIEETWRQHLSGRYDRTRALWPVLMFQAWLEEGRTAS